MSTALVVSVTNAQEVAQIWQDYVSDMDAGRIPRLPDFSYAGYKWSEEPIPTVTGPVFNVDDYGAVPNDGGYDGPAIQAAIDAAVNAGGGVVMFSAGEYTVSQTTDPNEAIWIRGSNVVLRGQGMGVTTIVQYTNVDDPNGYTIRATPWGSGGSTITTITQDAKQGEKCVKVASTGSLSEGQVVRVNYQSAAYLPYYFYDTTVTSAYSRLHNDGLLIKEPHTIDSIDGNTNTVCFYEPLMIDLILNTGEFKIITWTPLTGIGVESLTIKGRWDSVNEDFYHHLNALHDYGWNGIGYWDTVHSWARDIEITNVNQGFYTSSSSWVTVQNLYLTGKKGHMSTHARRGNGVLFKDVVDEASHHHGPGLGYSGAGTVYVRSKMNLDQRIDSHSGVPYTSLLDDTQGGYLWGSGGPIEGYPHHGHDFVFWNFAHRSSGDRYYDFWMNQASPRPGNEFYKPLLVGVHDTGGKKITYREGSEGYVESLGAPVLPKSLFEAQLEYRLTGSSDSGDDFDPSDNVIADPGFENGASGWTALHDGFDVVTTEAFEGSHSLRFDNSGGQSSFHGVAQAVWKPELNVRGFFATAQVKGSNLSGEQNQYCSITVVATFVSGREAISFSPCPTGTYDWTRITLERSYDEVLSSIEAYAFMKQKSGVVYFDEFYLVGLDFNLIANPGFELGWNGWNRPVFDSGWRPEEDITRALEGSFTARMASDTGGNDLAMVQSVRPPFPMKSFELSGWSRAVNAIQASGTDFEYSIYADVQLEDGSWDWGKFASFSRGSHDWQFKSTTVSESQNIQEVSVYCLFRKHTGEVLFDDIRLTPTDPPLDFDAPTAPSKRRRRRSLPSVRTESTFATAHDAHSDIASSYLVDPKEREEILTPSEQKQQLHAEPFRSQHNRTVREEKGAFTLDLNKDAPRMPLAEALILERTSKQQ
eukprot:Clim_evm140s149 gene=Clim_evmTU140s149